jgi:hypothetical protein
VAEVKTASISDMLQPLLTKAKLETATPGVIRGATEAGPDSTPWVLDVSKGGDFCVHQAVVYDLWRPDSSAASTVTIQPPSGAGAPVTVQFEAHRARATLPETFNFSDGGRYKVTMNGKMAEITVHTVPETVPLDRAAAAWFMSDHCEIQATALLKTL